MDTFKEEVYGKIQWECCRAKIYIVAMSLFYVLICATIITYAMEYGNILYVVAACVFCFSVCVSRKDKKKFKFWISKKQEENRHVSRLTF